MNIGSVVSTKAIKVLIQEGKGYLEYKCPKGKAFIFLCLGVEDIANPHTDSDQLLKDLGWEFKG